jgi:hypothetical protein
VVVRGLPTSCWKCHRPTTCVVAVHADGCRQGGGWAWFEDKPALELARQLLANAGHPLAATVKQRSSKTAGGAYLANGCEHCDAVQGDWPIGRVIFEDGLAAPLSGLPILASVPVERAAWHELVARQGTRRFGYPMRWEDLD